MKFLWAVATVLIFCLGTFFQSCDRSNEEEMPDGRYGYIAGLNLVLNIDTAGVYLDSCNNPAVLVTGHGAQSPVLNYALIEKVELFEDPATAYGHGYEFGKNYSSVYQTIHNNTETLDLSCRRGATQVTFHWIRIYIGYQNYKVKCRIGSQPAEYNLLSFLHDYQAYHQVLPIQDSTISLDSVKYKGEWFLEADSAGSGMVLEGISKNETAPDPFCATSPPLSQNLYVLTCPIPSGLVFYKNETKTLHVSISMKNCFEWIEHSDPAYFEPLDGDTIFDIGLRGAKVLQ